MSRLNECVKRLILCTTTHLSHQYDLKVCCSHCFLLLFVRTLFTKHFHTSTLPVPQRKNCRSLSQKSPKIIGLFRKRALTLPVPHPPEPYRP